MPNKKILHLLLKSIIFSSGLLLPLSFIYSTELGRINIRIHANLLSNTCAVSPNTREQTVNLGTWASRQFFAGPTPETTPIKFNIELTNCGAAAKGINITFNGNTDNNNSELFALNATSTAANVGVRIRDENSQKIIPGVKTSLHTLSGNNEKTLTFYGQYVATDSFVTPGTANADVTFEMEYL